MGPCDAVPDTNVWLDMLHFGDAPGLAVHLALRAGTVRLLASNETLGELARVVRYPALELDEASAAALLAKATSLAHLVGDGPVPARLPRCRDADDQKFIELAARGQARWLLTRDAELLRMAARLRRAIDLCVCTPAQWATHAAG